MLFRFSQPFQFATCIGKARNGKNNVYKPLNQDLVFFFDFPLIAFEDSEQSDCRDFKALLQEMIIF